MAVAVVVLVVLAVVASIAVGIYNNLIRLRNQLERAWANIDVILKQRYDEIPQLVQVIEQFSQFEANVIEKLVSARAHYGEARSNTDKMAASSEISMALKGVMAIGEAYPDLKSNQNFMQLQTRISQLENTLSDRREGYNDTVANFNTRIDQFPDVLLARMLNYNRQTMFEVAAAERQAPSLKMNLPKMGQSA